MKQYLVIGNPIEHSKSPIIHQHFAKQFDISLQYEKCLMALDSFETEVSALVALSEMNSNIRTNTDINISTDNKFTISQSSVIHGANVTLPFKERAFALCDEVSQRALLSKAVNTLSIKEGILIGDNTDGQGLVNDLLFNNVVIKDANILIIGAGGATRGCVPALMSANPESITITNRTLSKAKKIVDEVTEMSEVAECTKVDSYKKDYSPALTSMAFDDHQLKDGSFDIIINATSSSVTNQAPDISPAIFNNASAIYDMFYSDKQTFFLEWARQHLLQSQNLNKDVLLIDGLGMLIEQAAEAFFIWHQQRPETDYLRKLLR